MASLPRPDAGASGSGAAFAGRAAFLLLALVIAYRAVAFVVHGLDAVLNPYELDYGEGIVWQQMRMMFDGRGYAPVGSFPAIVFHYPPLFHAAAYAASAVGPDPLAAGRGVSLLSTFVCALLIGALTFATAAGEPRRVRYICGGAAAGIALSWFPVLAWAPLMRVDMLACALTLGGLLLALRSLDRPKLIYLASFLFVAAVYTKQTMIAAPAATFGVLLLVHPALAWRGLAAATLTGLAVMAWFAAATDGGFVRHVFLYNVNRFDPKQLILIPESILRHVILVGMAGIGLAGTLAKVRGQVGGLAGWRALRHRLAADAPSARIVMMLAYLLICTPMLLAIGKVGSNLNYHIEWMFALSLFAGLSLGLGARALFNRADDPGLLAGCVVPAAIALQLLILPLSPYRGGHSAELRSAMERLGTQIRQANGPVISDDMVLLLRNGREVLWEPAIFAELASTGAYDERPFVQKILNREIAFFVTFGDRGSTRFDQRYNPAVSEAMAVAYPVKQKLGNLVVHRPSGSWSRAVQRTASR